MSQVFTGAMALITVGTNNTPIGKMKEIRGSEEMTRARVGGLYNSSSRSPYHGMVWQFYLWTIFD